MNKTDAIKKLDIKVEAYIAICKACNFNPDDVNDEQIGFINQMREARKSTGSYDEAYQKLTKGRTLVNLLQDQAVESAQQIANAIGSFDQGAQEQAVRAYEHLLTQELQNVLSLGIVADAVRAETEGKLSILEQAMALPVRGVQPKSLPSSSEAKS